MSEWTSTAMVLAAGKGTRMKSALPKVLHEVAGRPMVAHVLTALQAAGADKTVLVVSPDNARVGEFASAAFPGIGIAVQPEALGTGDAVRASLGQIAGAGAVVVVFGDTPLLRPETVTRLSNEIEAGASVAVLGFEAADPTGYGRLVTGADGGLERIIEEKEASDVERALTLCNGGAMAFDALALEGLLAAVGNDNAKGEYYLTDCVGVARSRGLRVTVIRCPEEEILGVNSRADLAAAEKVAQVRLRNAAMAGGVTLIDPDTVYLCMDTQLGRDVVIEPNVVFGPGVTVGDDVHIKAFSHLEGASIGAGCDIGPFARLRPQAVLEEGARIGNFVEVKKTSIGKGAKANHFAYLGDAEVGAGSNIGAGTITCNYDGYDKHRTTIGEGVFIGSNSTLVAPVSILPGSYVAAGSVITDKVGPGALAFGRARQSEKSGWADAFHARKKSEKKKG